MPLQLNLPDSELAFWRDSYLKRYEEIVSQIDNLEEQLKQMRPVLIQLGVIEDIPENVNVPAVDSDGYDRSWKWLRKIEYLLERTNSRKTSTELIDEIMRREPGESRSRLVNSIPATLSTAANSVSTNLKRQKNAKGEFEYWVEDLPF